MGSVTNVVPGFYSFIFPFFYKMQGIMERIQRITAEMNSFLGTFVLLGQEGGNVAREGQDTPWFYCIIVVVILLFCLWYVFLRPEQS